VSGNDNWTAHLRVPFGAIFQTFETHGLMKGEMMVAHLKVVETARYSVHLPLISRCRARFSNYSVNIGRLPMRPAVN
jgi:hypothetical protein